MSTQPREGDALSVEDIKGLLLTIYLRDKRIAILEAELARLRAGVTSVQDAKPEAD